MWVCVHWSVYVSHESVWQVAVCTDINSVISHPPWESLRTLWLLFKRQSPCFLLSNGTCARVTVPMSSTWQECACEVVRSGTASPCSLWGHLLGAFLHHWEVWLPWSQLVQSPYGEMRKREREGGTDRCQGRQPFQHPAVWISSAQALNVSQKLSRWLSQTSVPATDWLQLYVRP